MASQQHPRRVWPIAIVLALSLGGIVAAFLLVSSSPDSRAVLWDIVTIYCGVASGLIILSARRKAVPEWKGTGFLALGMFAVAGAGVAFLAIEWSGARSQHGPSLYDLGFLAIAVPFLLPIVSEYRDHFEREDRREIGTDVALITAALGCIAYLSMLRPGADATTMLSAGIFALAAAAAFTGYGALALWVSTPPHVGMFLVFAPMSVATLWLGSRWVEGGYSADHPGLPLAFSIAGFALAAVVVIAPRRARSARVATSNRWGRPLLTSIAVVAACAALGTVAIAAVDERIDATQAWILVGVLAAAVAVRILVNQLRSSKATRAATSALEEKESALAETDLALERLRLANETLRESEEHLRLVFEAAVDGIVELDANDAILRANEAFCQMVRLPRESIEGQPWTAVAAAVDGSDDSFASLPTTGQGILQREGHPLHLESRLSEIPSHPAKRLLLVRDTTAAKVADQTIRSLFQFLQDRDEDRTRIMRRTNSAIEQERNRIARDLHDGPVQGVSAASLSLEAALLMIKAGELENGLDILNKIRHELSEEADSLRRLMSGLRPPLLEERGLVPAIRETLSKFGDEQSVETEFTSHVQTEVPTDLETLAYRIVQEALSNAGKHAAASRLSVSIEADAGQLRLEIGDDGVGFDSGQTRDYLRMGRVGLASMRERVELANGTFMVHSTPGRGTTILATLPLNSASASREVAV
jgi:PAS domain S-box-containing protein